MPPRAATVVAGLFGIVALALGLGPRPGLVALLVLVVAAGLMAWLCIKQIGGQTGDVLGAVEQVGEIAILLTAAART